MLKHVKLVLVLFSLVFVYFFITINSTYEVETIVQSKFDGLDCLRKYGGKISEIETGDKHYLPGFANINMTHPDGTQWNDSYETVTWLKSRTIHVSAKASNGADLNKINYYIYVPYGGMLCQGTVEDYNKAKSSAEFDVTFDKSTDANGIQLWMEIIDSKNNKSDDKGTESFIFIDNDAPKFNISKSEVIEENGERYLYVQFDLNDELSGIDSAKTKMVISNTAGYYSQDKFETINKNGSTPKSYSIYMKIPLSVAGEGKYSVHVEVQDVVGNKNSTSEGLFFDTNNPNAGLQMPGSSSSSGNATGTTTPDWTEVNTSVPASENDDSSIPGKTSVNKITIGDSQKITCDNSLQSFISEIWKYFVIFGPILLIVMVSLDFFKALFSSDSDMLTKSGSNTVKRTISAIILLLLPLIIETILGFFGLELCI